MCLTRIRNIYVATELLVRRRNTTGERVGSAGTTARVPLFGLLLFCLATSSLNISDWRLVQMSVICPGLYDTELCYHLQSYPLILFVRTPLPGIALI